jgi:hypothetical protein
VDAATAVFPLGEDVSVQPGWPGSAYQISILVQRCGTSREGIDEARIGFLVPDLAKPHLKNGARILIMEGPKVVAQVTVVEVFDHEDETR